MTSDFPYQFHSETINQKKKRNSLKNNVYWEICYIWRYLVVSIEWHTILSVFWIVGFIFEKKVFFFFEKNKLSFSISSLILFFFKNKKVQLIKWNLNGFLRDILHVSASRFNNEKNKNELKCFVIKCCCAWSFWYGFTVNSPCTRVNTIWRRT